MRESTSNMPQCIVDHQVSEQQAQSESEYAVRWIDDVDRKIILETMVHENSRYFYEQR